MIPKNTAPSELAQLRKMRWLGRTDLHFLCTQILGYKDITKEVHGPLLNVLQQFPLPPADIIKKVDIVQPGLTEYTPWQDRDKLEGKRRMLMLDPRSGLKTTIDAISHTIQWLLNYPHFAILIVQSNSEKVHEIIKEIKYHFQYNPIFREVYPDYCPQGRRVSDWGNRDGFTLHNRIGVCRRLGVVAHKEDSVTGSSIDKGSAGRHYEVLKFSDIVEPATVKTREQIQSTIYQFGMAENLLVKPNDWIDVEGTRYDFGDLYGRIIDNWLKDRDMGVESKWKIHVRGCYLKDIENPQYTPNELSLNFKKTENDEFISWWPDRWTTELLEADRKDPVKSEYLFACTPGYARILMSDWKEKPIQDVEIGDTVIGWDRVNNERPSFLDSKVLDKGSHKQLVIKVTLDSGNVLYCTEDHLWWNGRKKGTDTHNEYQMPDIRHRLVRVLEPIPELTTQQIADINWLAGFIDGEGRVASHKGGELVVTQSMKVNSHICARLEKCLQNLNISYKIWNRKKENTNYYTLQGGKTLRRMLMQYTDMAKTPSLLSSLGGKRIGVKDFIKSIEPVGIETVYWLTTETGNYISQGYCSKNCQKLNDPVSVGDKSQPFPVNDSYPKWITRDNFKKVPIAYRTITVDTADTVNIHSNHTVLTCAAWDQHGRCYVEEIDRGKYLPDEIVARLFQMNKKYKPLNINIEETAFVRGFKASILRRSNLDGTYLPLVFTKRENTASKQERIMATLQPWYESGHMRFLEDLGPRHELLQELSRFPKYDQDDILDTLADLYQNKEWFGREVPRPDTPDQFDRQYQDDQAAVVRSWTNLSNAYFNRWAHIDTPLDLDATPSYSPFEEKTGGL